MRLGNWVVRGGLLAGLCALAACGSSPTATATAVPEPHQPSSAPKLAGPAQAFLTVTNGTARFGHTATLLGNGQVLLTGGSTTAQPTPTTELINPSTLAATPGPSMSIERRWHTATMLRNGKVLVAGGWDGPGNHLDSAELFDPDQGTFSPVEPMDTARWEHTATRLQDGRVLLVGGTSGTSTSWVNTDSAELFDPATNTFSPAASLHLGRSHHTATLLQDGRVLVAGGEEAETNFSSKTVEIYDPALDQWTDLGPVLNRGRADHTATLLRDGRVLIVGGDNTSGTEKTAEIFDPATNVSTPTGSMKRARAEHTATLLPSGRVLVTGGINVNSLVPGTEEFDPVTGTWTPGFFSAVAGSATATLLPTGDVLLADGRVPSIATSAKTLYHPGYGEMTPAASTAVLRLSPIELVTLPSGRVLVLGGTWTPAERYDPATDSWSSAGDLHHGRVFSTSLLLADGRVLVVGGLASTPSSEIYDESANTWTETGPNVAPRLYSTATLLQDGRVLVAGGSDSSAVHSSTELYDPATNLWVAGPSMSAARTRAASVHLPDGHVLVCGGVQTDPSPTTLASCEKYDPASNTWSPAAPLSQARADFKLFSLPNGQVLATGSGAVLQSELYDPTSNVWVSGGTMLFEHEYGAFASLPTGDVVALGGVGPDVELYSWTTNTWRKTGALAQPRQFAGIAVLPSGWVLVNGGRDPTTSGSLKSSEIYVEPPNVSGVQPVIDPPGTLTADQPFTLTGLRFLGGTEANGGGTSSSPTNYPLVTLEPTGGGAVLHLPVSDFTDGLISLFAPDGLSGPYDLTVSVNGISTTTLTTLQPNQPPSADDQAVNLDEDTSVDVTVSGSDPEGGALAFALGTGPSNGSVTFTAPDQFHYVPNANFNGTDSFTFTVTDDHAQSATGTVTLSVASVNDAPVANDDAGNCPEDSSCGYQALVSDPDGDPLTLVIVTPPAHGNVSPTTTPLGFAYTPNVNFNGSDSFTFKVNDGTVDSLVATFSLTIPARNDAPIAPSSTIPVNEDTPASITLFGSDADGDPLQYTVVDAPTHGTLVLKTAPNDFTYTPEPNFNGTDSFTYKVNDGTVDSGAGTVTLDVQAVNDAPVAYNGSFNVPEDSSTAFPLNASDVDGDSLTYVIVSGPSHGTVTLNTAPNIFVYAPDPDTNGPDSFTFKVNDGTVDSNVATISLTVPARNDQPVATPMTVTLDEDTSVDVTLSGSDVDGDTLQYIKITDPTHGTLVLKTAPNVYTYTPGPDFNGADSFTFNVKDATLYSTVATVSFVVSPVNDAPVADDASATTGEDTSTVINLSASDVDGDRLQYTIVKDPDHGTVSFVSGNRYTYTPDADYAGPDNFIFHVYDGTTFSNQATVTLEVTGANDAPAVADLSLTTEEDTALDVTPTAVDPDGDAVSFTIVTQPAHGTVTGTSPDFVYTPEPGYFGLDSFTLAGTDGTAPSAPATVSITVTAVNDAPVASPQTVQLAEEGSVAITLAGTDEETDVLTFRVVTPPAHGTLSGAAPNLTYTPNPDFSGEDSFTFVVNDGTADSAPATVTLKVGGTNDAPVAQPLAVQTGGAPVAVTLVGTDVDGDALQYTVVDAPAHGTLSGTAPDLTYTPEAGFFGTDRFTFKVSDGQEESDVATVTVDVVENANNAPGTPKLAFPAGDDKVVPGKVELGWSSSVDPDGDAVSYRVEVLQGDQVVATAQTERLTASVGPLSEGSYTWRVTAVDAKGMASAPSELRAFSVLPLEVAGGCTAAPGSSGPLTGMVVLALLFVPFWRRRVR